MCITCMYHLFFKYSSVDKYLSCFHVLAIVNSAVMNAEVHVYFWMRTLSVYMPRSGISQTYEILCLVF